MYLETGPEPWVIFYVSSVSKRCNVLKTNPVKDSPRDTDRLKQV